MQSQKPEKIKFNVLLLIDLKQSTSPEVRQQIQKGVGMSFSIRLFDSIFGTNKQSQDHKITNDQILFYCKYVEEWRREEIFSLNRPGGQFILKTICHIKFSQLKVLALLRMDIYSIENLSLIDLPCLELLHLTQNMISSLKPLRKCQFTTVKQLKLNGNLFNQSQLNHLIRMKSCSQCTELLSLASSLCINSTEDDRKKIFQKVSSVVQMVKYESEKVVNLEFKYGSSFDMWHQQRVAIVGDRLRDVLYKRFVKGNLHG